MAQAKERSSRLPVVVIGGHHSGKSSLIRHLVATSTRVPSTSASRHHHIDTIRYFTMELIRGVWQWCDMKRHHHTNHRMIERIIAATNLTDEDAAIVQVRTRGATAIYHDVVAYM